MLWSGVAHCSLCTGQLLAEKVRTGLSTSFVSITASSDDPVDLMTPLRAVISGSDVTRSKPPTDKLPSGLGFKGNRPSTHPLPLGRGLKRSADKP